MITRAIHIELVIAQQRHSSQHTVDSVRVVDYRVLCILITLPIFVVHAQHASTGLADDNEPEFSL